MEGAPELNHRGVFTNEVQNHVPSEAGSSDNYQRLVGERHLLASSPVGDQMERGPQENTYNSEQTSVQNESVHRESEREYIYESSDGEYEGHIRDGDNERYNRENRIVREHSLSEEAAEDSRPRSHLQYPEISLRRDIIKRRRITVGCGSQIRSVQHVSTKMGEVLERTNTMARGSQHEIPEQSQLVIISFNCENFQSELIKDLISQYTNDSTAGVIFCGQESWLYDFPNTFKSEMSRDFDCVHESAMNLNNPQSKGRPYGGIFFLIPKTIAYSISYTNPRCLAITLTNYDILLCNVYIPYDNSRKSVQHNLEDIMETIGHISAAHEISGTTDCIMTGDFNCSPLDFSKRGEALASFLNSHNYEDEDLLHYSDSEYSLHHSQRLIDRFVTTPSVSKLVQKVAVHKHYSASAHYPIVAKLTLPRMNNIASPPTESKPTLLWKKASQSALNSYSRLCQKECAKLLKHYENNLVTDFELHEKLIHILENSAEICIPKAKNKGIKRHNIPFWRERMSHVQKEVDRWVLLRDFHGGKHHCPEVIKDQLRRAKLQYKRQLRELRRDVEASIADRTTTSNCFNKQFRKPKSTPPAMVDGCSKSEQPDMWRKHFKSVFKAEETPHNGNLCDCIDEMISVENPSPFF